MTTHEPWGGSSRDELGRALAGPEPDLYLARMRGFLARLPERDTGWDVLAGWARPGVVAAAMAAAFLLGVALFAGWPARLERPGPAPVPAAALLAPTADDPGPITFAVLEGP